MDPDWGSSAAVCLTEFYNLTGPYWPLLFWGIVKINRLTMQTPLEWSGSKWTLVVPSSLSPSPYSLDTDWVLACPLSWVPAASPFLLPPLSYS